MSLPKKVSLDLGSVLADGYTAVLIPTVVFLMRIDWSLNAIFSLPVFGFQPLFLGLYASLTVGLLCVDISWYVCSVSYDLRACICLE